MEERGVGHLVDALVFALLLSMASSLLLNANPVPRAGEARYASSFAQSTLLALRSTTSDGFGGFEYDLSVDVPIWRESLKRKLHHKTLAQLLTEDALLNMQVEVENIDLPSLNPSRGMGEELREFIRSALDRLIGERFGYRLIVRSEPLVLGTVRIHFETKIERLNDSKRKLCSESTMMILPITREELRGKIERMSGIQLSGLNFDPDLVIEVTLELWSK